MRATQNNTIILTSPPHLAKQRGIRSAPERILHPEHEHAVNVLRAIEMGKLPSAVREIVQGRLITDFTVTEAISPAGLCIDQAANLARLDLIGSLIQSGYRVALMIAHPDTGSFPEEDFMEQARGLGITDSDIVEVKATGRAGLSWPRNLFAQIGSNVYLRDDLDSSWLNRLGIRPDQIERSIYGNGAVTILGKNLAFVTSIVGVARIGNPGLIQTEAAEMKLIERDWVSKLMQHGYPLVYTLSPPAVDLFSPRRLRELGLSSRYLAPSCDLDYVLFSSSPADSLFALHGDYAETQPGALRILRASHADHRVAILPKGNHLYTNSLALPGGGVFMDAGAGEAKACIEALGVRVLTTQRAHDHYGFPGGIGCATNVLTLP